MSRRVLGAAKRTRVVGAAFGPAGAVRRARSRRDRIVVSPAKRWRCDGRHGQAGGAAAGRGMKRAGGRDWRRSPVSRRRAVLQKKTPVRSCRGRGVGIGTDRPVQLRRVIQRGLRADFEESPGLTAGTAEEAGRLSVVVPFCLPSPTHTLGPLASALRPATRGMLDTGNAFASPSDQHDTIHGCPLLPDRRHLGLATGQIPHVTDGRRRACGDAS